MKRLLIFILSILIMLPLTACGSSEEELEAVGNVDEDGNVYYLSPKGFKFKHPAEYESSTDKKGAIAFYVEEDDKIPFYGIAPVKKHTAEEYLNEYYEDILDEEDSAEYITKKPEKPQKMQIGSKELLGMEYEYESDMGLATVSIYAEDWSYGAMVYICYETEDDTKATEGLEMAVDTMEYEEEE